MATVVKHPQGYKVVIHRDSPDDKRLGLDNTLEDHGPKYRIERHSYPGTVDAAGVPTYTWKVYEAVHTGLKLHPEIEGHPAIAEVRAHPHKIEPIPATIDGVPVVKELGVHPVAKDRHGNPSETHLEHVWVPVFAGSEKDARARLLTLVAAAK